MAERRGSSSTLGPLLIPESRKGSVLVSRVNDDSSPSVSPKSAGRRGSSRKSGLTSAGVLELAKAQAELIHLLTRSGAGSFLRGWRCQLDPDGNLEVDFKTFCEAAARIDFTINVQVLFGSDMAEGELTLVDLAPREGALMNRFKRWVHVLFQTPAGMFQQFTRTAANGQGAGDVKLSRQQFLLCVTDRGFEATMQEILEVFDCCDTRSNESISVEEVLFLEIDRKVRETERLKTRLKSRRDWNQELTSGYLEECAMDPMHRLASRPWQATFYQHLPQVMCQRRLCQAKEVFRRQREAVQVFQRHVRAAYGNEVRAFRRALASESSPYAFSQKDLMRFCCITGLHIDSRLLFRALDRDGDSYVCMEELCSHRGSVLAHFRQWVLSGEWMDDRDKQQLRTPSCAALWDRKEFADRRRAVKADGRWTGNSVRKMSLASFREALRDLGAPAAANKDTRTLLLSSLDLQGCGFITSADLEWLDGWQAPGWLCAKPNKEAWEALRRVLLENFEGLLLKAWRECLDQDNSNRISWVEFRNACSSVNFEGDVGGAWCYLDDDLSGFISMREFCPDTAALLESFKEWSEQNFGSVAECFRVIDSDRSGAITFPELQRACTKLLWSGNVRLLFDVLKGKVMDTHTGKRSITLEEVQFLDNWRIRQDLRSSDRYRDELGEEDSVCSVAPIIKHISGISPRRARGVSKRSPLGTPRRHSAAALRRHRSAVAAPRLEALAEPPSQPDSVLSLPSGAVGMVGKSHEAPGLLPLRELSSSGSSSRSSSRSRSANSSRSSRSSRSASPVSGAVAAGGDAAVTALGATPPLAGPPPGGARPLGSGTAGVCSAPQLGGMGHRPHTAPLGNQRPREPTLDTAAAALAEAVDSKGRCAAARELAELKDKQLHLAYWHPQHDTKGRRPKTAGAGAAVGRPACCARRGGGALDAGAAVQQPLRPPSAMVGRPMGLALARAQRSGSTAASSMVFKRVMPLSVVRMDCAA